MRHMCQGMSCKGDNNGGGGEAVMPTRVSIEGSMALALAAKVAKVDVVAAYPITPQTHVIEYLSEFVAKGEMDVECINVESEHSAMSACIGASATGARVFTA